ncbi:histidine kinase [Glycocaulis profundi]|nr:histidine kinase [Glycocaulis profundi]
MADKSEETRTLSRLSAPDRPRRRDILVCACLGVGILTVLMASGALGFGPWLAGALTLSALAFIYWLTALTTAEARPAPARAERRSPEGEAADVMLGRLSIPVLLIGPGGRIERANPAARAFLALGSEGGLLSTALRQPRVLEAVGAALKGERAGVVEYSALTPVESHVRAYVEPIRLDVPGPLPFRAMLVLADETSSKRAERMRADFLANASHELRTPLASLSGFIETIAGPARDDPEAQERFLGIMRDQTERMKRLIDDLLSLSRVEMNEHLPPSSVTDLAQLAADVIDSLSPVAAARSILIRAELPGGPALVTGDRDQLHEVVENLVENALKYSADGSSIRVSLHDGAGRDAAEYAETRLGEAASRMTLTAPAYEAEARYAAIRVRDSGVGIDRRYLPRLAERFFRVDGQKSGPTSGTGLGLAIVKHIVTRHRGGLTVESAPGGGSVFSVFFPKAAEPAQALETRESAE